VAFKLKIGIKKHTQVPNRQRRRVLVVVNTVVVVSSRKLLVIQVFISAMHSVNFVH